MVTMICDAGHMWACNGTVALLKLPVKGRLRMACYVAHSDLYAALERRCEKVRKRRSTVLFRRGAKAFGMFLVVRGAVRLDFGVDASTALDNICGPGALVGLPATLSRTNYSMTATVTEDAELGFLTPQDLVSLLHQRPELRQHLLSILSAKVAHSEQVAKALLCKEKPPGPELGAG